MSFLVTNSRIAFQITKISTFRHNRNTKSDSDIWSYQPVNCICTKKYTMHHGSFRGFFWLVLKRVWCDIRDSGNGSHCLLTVRGWLRGVKIGVECVNYVWLSCPARPSKWVLCISMQWLRFKGCHVSGDECVSGGICSLQTHVDYRVCHVGSHEWHVTKIWGPRCERD